MRTLHYLRVGLRITMNHYAMAHAYNTANAHAQGSAHVHLKAKYKSLDEDSRAGSILFCLPEMQVLIKPLITARYSPSTPVIKLPFYLQKFDAPNVTLGIVL